MIGRSPDSRGKNYNSETPQKDVFLNGFYIDKYEVSNRQFRKFLRATGYRMQGDSNWILRPGKEDHPAAAVTWTDAAAYARWAGKRLPTEMEWEKAARCTALARLYPWGFVADEPDVSRRANYKSPVSPRGATVPVDSLELARASTACTTWRGT